MVRFKRRYKKNQEMFLQIKINKMQMVKKLENQENKENKEVWMT